MIRNVNTFFFTNIQTIQHVKRVLRYIQFFISRVHCNNISTRNDFLLTIVFREKCIDYRWFLSQKSSNAVIRRAPACLLGQGVEHTVHIYKSLVSLFLIVVHILHTDNKDHWVDIDLAEIQNSGDGSMSNRCKLDDICYIGIDTCDNCTLHHLFNCTFAYSWWHL